MDYTANDHAELSDRLQLYTESLPSQVSTYVKRKIMPHLVSNKRVSTYHSLTNVSPLWKNSNSESLNHCFKQATLGKTLKLVKLILKLENLVLAFSASLIQGSKASPCRSRRVHT
ncbi:hypothetical protein RRG08_016889 [Elysia crispata]|uniref:Uncharacterized protein n=1 Tax=Elysia crispata TaxID=231223 RepID=A0AAE0ZEL1_9GAST|nr:hypothetical protein RRG08_016889 [Elysia crispata]